jgi:hypothetical protein
LYSSFTIEDSAKPIARSLKRRRDDNEQSSGSLLDVLANKELKTSEAFLKKMFGSKRKRNANEESDGKKKVFCFKLPDE